MDASAQMSTRLTISRLLVLLLLLFGVASAITGCSKPTDANRRNFTDAINVAIADSIFIGFEEMPVIEFNSGYGGRRLARTEQRFETGDRYLKVPRQLFNDRKRALLIEDLVGHDILIPWMKGYFTGQGPFDIPNDIYLFKAAHLSKAKVFRSGAATIHQFYCGKPGVGKIVGWTEPGKSNGVTITSVSYQVKLFDSPDWSSSLRKYLDETLSGEKNAMLVLTAEGWRTQ